MCTQGGIASSNAPSPARCLLNRRIHYTPPNGSDVMYAAILPVPFTHLMSPLIEEQDHTTVQSFPPFDDADNTNRTAPLLPKQIPILRLPYSSAPSVASPILLARRYRQVPSSPLPSPSVASLILVASRSIAVVVNTDQCSLRSRSSSIRTSAPFHASTCHLEISSSRRGALPALLRIRIQLYSIEYN